MSERLPTQPDYPIATAPEKSADHSTGVALIPYRGQQTIVAQEAAPPASKSFSSGFDYSLYTPNFASAVRAAGLRIRDHVRSRVEAMLAIGRELTAVKIRLGHGRFQDWVACELNFTIRTAEHYMAAAALVGGKSEIVSHLPSVTIYRLASSYTPETVRESVMPRLARGERIAPAEIESLILGAREAKARAKKRKKKELALHKKRAWAPRTARQEEESQATERRLAENAAVILIDRCGDQLSEILIALSRCNAWQLRMAVLELVRQRREP